MTSSASEQVTRGCCSVEDSTLLSGTVCGLLQQSESCLRPPESTNVAMAMTSVERMDLQPRGSVETDWMPKNNTAHCILQTGFKQANSVTHLPIVMFVK
jgi:hypothetical protein